MKKFLFLCAFLSSTLFATPHVSKDLTGAFQRIMSLPEGQNLVRDAEARGPISIYSYSLSSVSNAVWEPDERAVIINLSTRPSFGQTIRSILFELQNAVMDSEFYQLDHLAALGKISKQQYVESKERIEHSNVLKTKVILHKGMQMGIFPPDCFWPIPDNFNDYFRMQIQTGHSDQIALLYDELTHHHYVHFSAKTR